MESFWDYSIRVYALPRVSESCLTLQDEFGFDVNLILFSCWHGREYGALNTSLLHKCLTFSALWSTKVVQPLRSARRWMKSPIEIDADKLLTPKVQTDFQQLRAQIKKIELQSEKFQEEMLESFVTEKPRELALEQRIDASIVNLRLLAEHSSIAMSEPLARMLVNLVLGIIPPTPIDDAARAEVLLPTVTASF